MRSKHARKVWTEQMIASLKEMRAAGYNYRACGDALGMSAPTARSKGKELGLPSRVDRGPYNGLVTRYLQSLPPPDTTAPRQKIACVLAQLQVGEHHDFTANSSSEIKRVHKLVSQFGVLHGKGFRGRTNRIDGVLRVTRMR